MNNLVEAFKNDENVKKYIVLRSFIMNNQECYQELKAILSRHKATYTDSKYEIIIDEYLELEKHIKEDLKIINEILENGINDDLAE